MVNGNKIKRIMEEKGILNKELAADAGISEAMMTYIIKGLREPTVAVLSRIAKKLDCTVDSLLAW